MESTKQDLSKQPTKRGNPYMGFLWGILIVLFLNGLVFPSLMTGKFTKLTMETL